MTAAIMCFRVAVVGWLLTGAAATAANQKNPVRYENVSERLTIEDGLYVSQYPDGSGSVSTSSDILQDAWRVRCAVDAMTDKLDCTIESKVGGPVVYYDGTPDPVEVCVIGHDFPGETAMMRVDKNGPLTTKENGCVPAGDIIPQMLVGQRFVGRYVEWPYNNPGNETTDLAGFRKVLELVTRIRSGR